MSFTSRWIPTALTLGLALFPAARVLADDETDQTQLRVEGPLDAVDCTAGAENATVLGLNISLASAQFDGIACSNLAVGQGVEVDLVSDVAPLTATQIKGRSDSHLRIQAPLQAVDAVAQTITVMGLTVDASTAQLDGAGDQGEDSSSSGQIHKGSDDTDPNSQDGNDPTGDPNDSGDDNGDDNQFSCDGSGPNDCQPITLADLVVGQFVEMKLDPAALPRLVATDLEVKNFANELSVQVLNGAGRPLTDRVSVKIVATTMVHDASGNLVSKTVRLRDRGHRSLLMGGLPTGRARVVVKDLRNGHISTLTGIPIRADIRRTVQVRVH